MNLTEHQRSILASRILLDFDSGISDAGMAYFGSRLPGKESWIQTDEGYRIYLNVPICRTGSQEYLGRELKKNRGYKAEWGLRDDEMVTVFRPLEEVTSPETIASFEGKSVLDEHPEGEKVLIDAIDEIDGYTKGHTTNVRVGQVLDSGETPLIADLWVKHPELNLKIEGYGCTPVRDVSSGYTFILDRDTAGQYYMRKIRGNHNAIVPKGRAGSEIGIRDAALSLKRSSTMAGKFAAPKTPIRDFFIALGFKNWAATASDEAVADALSEMKGAKDEESEEKKDDKKEEKKDKEGAKDKKGAKDEDDEHPKGCRCTDCMGAKDEDLEDVDKEDEEESAADKRKGAKDKKGAKDDAEILTGDERSESEFPLSTTGVKDAVANLRTMKPVVAASKDPKVRSAYNAEVRRARALQAGVKDGSIAVDPYLSLTRISPEDGLNDADDDIPMWSFFNGKPYHEGLKDYNDYQLARQRRS